MTIATTGGHPRGLYYLAFTEMWERFSYYGMTALLTLYMVKQLLLPGHAENVLGLDGLRSLFEFRGAMSNLAFAALIYGWYGGLVYFTPILGGLIADRWLGAKRTVVIVALLMSAGHLAMSFDASFLIALLLLILGSGCLKGNISAQVGTLYSQAAASLRERGFTIFSNGINIGSVIWSIGIVWIDAEVGLATALGTVPAGWFNSLDSLGSLLAAAPLVALWAAQARRKAEPASLTKIAVGSLIMGVAILLLAAGSLLPNADGKVSVWWAIAAYLGAGFAFMWYWPITLAILSAPAPDKIKSTLMGSAFLALFVGTVIMGWVGSFYDQMTPGVFWTLDASIAIAGAIGIFIARRPLARMLASSD